MSNSSCFALLDFCSFAAQSLSAVCLCEGLPFFFGFSQKQYYFLETILLLKVVLLL